MKSFACFRHASPILCAIAYALLLQASAASAGAVAKGGGLDLQPAVVGAGGTIMRGSTWTLYGTIAQPDAIVQEGADGVHLEGGFWHAAQSVHANDFIFANGFDL